MWSIYLAAFYPAIMSFDSVVQWRQLATFRFNDHHPAAHTLLEWLVTRLWFSPAAVAVFQIAVLAALTGVAARELRRGGAPPWLVAAFTAFVALHPLNGMYSVTLWKDVLFGAAVLAALVVMTGIARSGGARLRERGTLLRLAAALTFVALLRHNGTFVVAATLAALLLAYRRHARMLAVATAGVALAVFLVRVPLYRAIGVEPRGSVVPTLEAWHLGAVVASGEALTAGEAALAAEILPLDEWKRRYSPYTVDYFTNAPAWNGRFFWTGANRARLGAAWRELIRRHPGVLARHVVKNSSLVWRVRPFPDGYTMSMWFGIDPNEFGLAPRPLSPVLHARLDDMTRGIATDPLRVALLCRPALYLYAGLGATLLLAKRRGDRRVLVLAAPVVSVALPLLLFLPCQDTRYLYPVMLAAPFLVAQAVAPWRGSSRGDPAGGKA